MTFLGSLNPETLSVPNRWMFAVENAHWKYEDNLEQGSEFPSLNLLRFTRILLTLETPLNASFEKAEEYVKRFTDYKATVPTYGCMLTDRNREYVVMIRASYAKKGSWSFPGGKIEYVDAQSGASAAFRETEEETGFRVAQHVAAYPDSVCHEMTIRRENRAPHTVYVVEIPIEFEDGVPVWKHVPTVQGEVSEVIWHELGTGRLFTDSARWLMLGVIDKGWFPYIAAPRFSGEAFPFPVVATRAPASTTAQRAPATVEHAAPLKKNLYISPQLSAVSFLQRTSPLAYMAF